MRVRPYLGVGFVASAFGALHRFRYVRWQTDAASFYRDDISGVSAQG
jgi:hypothetical protein